MTTHVFVGPTLRSGEIVARLPEAVIHPPIRHGDPFRIALEPGDTVAVIDGLFFQSTAVRHKELLWLLSRSIRVVGASSMGALRAAELDRFGMRGMGDIYLAFSTGRIDADDEVAVAHGDAADDWAGCSDSLVNLRAAAARAHSAGVLSSDEATAFVDEARSTYFADRHATLIVRRCVADGSLGVATGDRFAAWLHGNDWNAKADDARLLLDSLATNDDAIRAADARDWRIGEMSSFVHVWQREFTPIGRAGVTGRDVEGLQLFATDAPDVVARLGRTVATRSWDSAPGSDLVELCRDAGFTRASDQIDEALKDHLHSEERAGRTIEEQVALALSRIAFAAAGHAEPRPRYPVAAVDLAAEVATFNAELARRASHHRPEHIAPATVDRYFARWWAATRRSRHDEGDSEASTSFGRWLADPSPSSPRTACPSCDGSRHDCGRCHDRGCGAGRGSLLLAALPGLDAPAEPAAADPPRRRCPPD